MSAKVYLAKPGSRWINNDDAVEIGGYLEKSFGKHDVRPADFVAAARAKRSPLHKHLTWDDKEAGEKFRLHEARNILRSIYVIVRTSEGEKPTRAYHNVVVTRGEAKEPTYVPQQVVWRTPDLRQQVIEGAARDVERATDRLDDYEDLSGVTALFRKGVTELREKAAA